MKRVIVPLDGSMLSEQAIPAGAYLARIQSCMLELVHIIDHPLRDDAPESKITPAPESVRRDLKAAADRFAIGVPVSCNALVGDPVRRLLQISERDPDAVIVMATHGRGGVVRAVLGSVADKVVRGASGPVLLIRPSAQATPAMERIDTVLVALDGSMFSERSLPAASELARNSGARLHLVRVVESLWSLAYPTSPYDGAAPDPQVIQDLDQQLSDEATAYLGEQAARLRREGVEVTWAVVRGNPVEELLFEAIRVSAGMIVLTSHGRGGLARMFQGSVATGLISRSNVPVLVVPAAMLSAFDTARYEPEVIQLL